MSTYIDHDSSSVIVVSENHFCLQPNKRDFVVMVRQAPDEMQKGVEMLPPQCSLCWQFHHCYITHSWFTKYSKHSIPTDQDPHQPRPVLTARGHFSALVELAQLDPHELYLTNTGDMILTHRVPIHDDEGTVPAFVAIAFFLEEQEPHTHNPPSQEVYSQSPAKAPGEHVN
jgi:hypothetical protein